MLNVKNDNGNYPQYAPNADGFISNQNEQFINAFSKDKNSGGNVDLDAQAEFLKKVANGDKDARKVFNETLVENVTMTIPAQTMFGQFFEMGTFKPDRRTWYYTIEEDYDEANEDLEVSRIYRNGNSPRAEIVQGESYVQVQPYQITSEEYYMDKFALELGIIEEPKKLQQKAANNVAWKLETDAESILTNGLYDDLSTITGININSRVSNYPTSNKLDLSSYDGLNINTLKDIAKYAKRMGKQIETIYAPVSAELEMWDWLGVPENYTDQDSDAPAPSEIVPELIKERIVEDGTPGQLFGKNFDVQSVNTLNDDPTEDDMYMWVKFNGGCGHLRYLVGGSFSDEYTHEDANKIYYNLKKTLMLFQTPKDRTNYARVKIKSQA